VNVTKWNLGARGLALAAILLAAPVAARAATISMTGTGGPTVAVTLAISGVEALAEPSLGSFDFDLGFDDSVLSFADVQFGTFLGGPADSLQSEGAAGGVVDLAEVSLVFPNVLLQDLQPDAFILATVLFDVLVTETTTTTISLTQALLSDGNAQAISVDPVASIELQAAIPEVGGAHVFALGLLVVLAGRALRSGGRTALRTGS